MIKVKFIKHPEDQPYLKYTPEVGEVYEAFETKWDNQKGYALNIDGEAIYFAHKEQCEIIEEEPRLIISTEENENHSEILKRLNKEGFVTASSNVAIKEKILIVEDGSVDINDLEEWCNENNIKLIVYRNGANPPAWLD